MTNRKSRRTALVIGCGIGGPVMAMALQRVGIDASIHEAHAGSADYVGSFLNVASNGLGALRAIDAKDVAVAAGFPTPRMTMWSGTGKKLGEVANGMTLDDGTTSITVERGLLHRALREEALRRGLSLSHGKRLVSAQTHGAGVVAHFDDGTEARADLLIGMDGLRSRVRTAIDPQAPAPRYTGQLSVGGVARGTTIEPTPGAYHMIFGQRAFFGYSVRPSGDAYWFANLAAPEERARASTEELRAELCALFDGDAGPALAMIRGTTTFGAYPVYDMPPVPTWHRGRIVVAGDAAHATSPSSGQGASMAIEDAIVLARCLRDAPTIEEAFASYEASRRARVERVVAYSARIGSTKVPGTVGRFFRDLFMPTALRMFATPTAHAWLYAHPVDDLGAPPSEPQPQAESRMIG